MKRSSLELNRWLNTIEDECDRRKGTREKYRPAKNGEPMVGKPSMQDGDCRKENRRVDEFDLGEIFTVISDAMRKEMESVVGKAPKEMQNVMKEGLSVMAKAVEDTMSEISDSARQERKEREEWEKETEEKLIKLNDKVEEKVKVVQAEVDSLKSKMEQIRLGEEVKEMECKVKSALSMVKVLDINIGQATDNKATIVREALGEVRRYTRKEEVACLDRILKRTRVVVLGRRTEGRQEGGRTVHTVPILFQCQDRKDAQELDRTLRKAGYFPTFHWPGEILEFIGKVRKEVRSMSSTEHGSYIRIRPEIVEGTVLIRADVKGKAENRFVKKGIWVCPPLNRELWEKVERLYTPQVGVMG